MTHHPGPGRSDSAVITIALVGALLGLLGAGEPARAASDDALDSLQALVTDKDTSPIPLGWSAGAAAYTGASPYHVEPNSVTAFPGAIYMSPTLMYLGDRASATVYQQGLFRVYGRGRLRLNSLNPDDHPEWSGLQARRWEVEGGLGAQVVTPVGLLTLRADSDVMNRSRGQDALVSMDVPSGAAAISPTTTSAAYRAPRRRRSGPTMTWARRYRCPSRWSAATASTGTGSVPWSPTMSATLVRSGTARWWASPERTI